MDKYHSQAIEKRSDIEVYHVDTAVRWRAAVNTRLVVRVLGGSIQMMRDILGQRQSWSGIVLRRCIYVPAPVPPF